MEGQGLIQCLYKVTIYLGLIVSFACFYQPRVRLSLYFYFGLYSIVIAAVCICLVMSWFGLWFDPINSLKICGILIWISYNAQISSNSWCHASKIAAIIMTFLGPGIEPSLRWKRAASFFEYLKMQTATEYKYSKCRNKTIFQSKWNYP